MLPVTAGGAPLERRGRGQGENSRRRKSSEVGKYEAVMSEGIDIWQIPPLRCRIIAINPVDFQMTSSARNRRWIVNS